MQPALHTQQAINNSMNYEVEHDSNVLNLPLRLFTNALSVGLPGRENASSTPDSLLQKNIALLVNSVPLFLY
jgi:hypothetical protein